MGWFGLTRLRAGKGKNVRQEIATFGGSKNSKLRGLSRRSIVAACSALTFSTLPVCSTKAQTNKTPSTAPQPSKNQTSLPTQSNVAVTYVTITYIGGINNDGVAKISTALANAIGANPAPDYILFGIDSLGEESPIGPIAIYNLLMASPIPIVTINLGYVSEAAVAIFLAGDVRIALPNSTFKLCSLSYNTNKNYDYDALNLKSDIEAIQIDELNLENIYKARANLSDSVINGLRASDLYLNAWQAKDLHIATRVGDIRLPHSNKLSYPYDTGNIISEDN